ncbi:MAG TPA: hypothetical protein VGP82_14585 [Ktedonobacterales bacterium]|nr:hypothetical protein [Ktedonobacterales bacterium]
MAYAAGTHFSGSLALVREVAQAWGDRAQELYDGAVNARHAWWLDAGDALALAEVEMWGFA